MKQCQRYYGAKKKKKKEVSFSDTSLQQSRAVMEIRREQSDTELDYKMLC